MKKNFLFIILFLPLIFNSSCGSDPCEIKEKVNRGADLVVKVFQIINITPKVDEIVETGLTILNVLLRGDCEEQEDAGESFSNYEVFYRESPNDDFELVQTSNDFKIPILAPEEIHEVNDKKMIFTQQGEYFLKCIADVGDDVIEENEDNNTKENEGGIQPIGGRSKKAKGELTIIKVSTDATTDFELMRKRKSEGLYVIFKN